MSGFTCVLALLLASMVSLGLVAGPEKGGKAGKGGAGKGELAFVLTEPRVLTHPPMRLVYVSATTKLAGGQIGKDIAALMDKLTPEVIAAIRPLSGPVTIYTGNTGDPNAPFKVQLGFPVAAGTAAPAGFEVVDLPEYKAFSLVYSGPTSQLSKAYTMGYERLFQDGLFPEGSSREHMLNWEGADSPNNVSVIQIGLQ